MNNPTIQYDKTKNIWENGRILAKLMQSERKGHAARGFFFCFESEPVYFRNYSQKVDTAAGYMMDKSKYDGKPVEVFRNMNGEIAARLKVD